ncbi:unnamed protein product [Triticum turgidum subsp. durum]|uniref:glutathione-specific gamma-glutamylcyclotransferase n=1 Tax=Triticum turgidum subsp. durum TaxID=4567 RepID=A0A9R1NXR8_TRITD|nr:unnamed protein product [Triticum turgidum subsp. durum]
MGLQQTQPVVVQLSSRPREGGSTDHRGTPEFPGRTVTLEHQPGSTCVRRPTLCSQIRINPSFDVQISVPFLFLTWGVAYKISREQDKQTALEYLEVREKQYDEKVYLDLYTDSSLKIPAVQDMMVYLATTNKEANQNYLGPAPLEEMAKYSTSLTSALFCLN